MVDVNIFVFVLNFVWDLDGLELFNEISTIRWGEETSIRYMRCILFNYLPVEVGIGLFNSILSLIKKRVGVVIMMMS